MRSVKMEARETHSDDELLRLMRAGDEEAFALLYRRWQGAVYRFAWQMSGTRAVAEDVTQEVFVALIKEAHHYDPARGSLSAYLYGIARYQVLRRLRRERVFVSLADTAAEESGTAAVVRSNEPNDLFADLARHEMVERLRAAVLALPPRYREAVVLCDLHEMSYAEAAAVIGCAVGTVRSRLSRARALLMERIRAGAETVVAAPQTKAIRCLG